MENKTTGGFQAVKDDLETDDISEEDEAAFNASLLKNDPYYDYPESDHPEDVVNGFSPSQDQRYHTESNVEAVSNVMMASSELPADGDNTALDTITYNPDAYKPMGWQKERTIVVKFITDSVPGAWHDPEDMVKSILLNPYVQSVTLKT